MCYRFNKSLVPWGVCQENWISIVYIAFKDKVATFKILTSTLPGEGGDLSRLTLIELPFHWRATTSSFGSGF